MDFLDFEKPIVELEKQIDDLKHNLSEERIDVEIDDEIKRLEQKCEELTKKIPLGRIGNVEDVVSLVLFLSSEDSNYITGQTLVVDGGLFMK